MYAYSFNFNLGNFMTDLNIEIHTSEKKIKKS